MKKQETKFTYGGIEIDILNQENEYVPQAANPIELSEEDAQVLATGVQKYSPILLVGETGTGKTSAVKYLAYKRKQGYTRISMHGYSTPDELIGSKSVKDGNTYYEDGVLTHAMRHGHIVVLDEINATPADCMFILHGLTDDEQAITLPNGDVVRPHPDFRFFATMNPDYEGTKTLNRAFMNRFDAVIAVDILPAEKERALLMQRTGIDENLASRMVSVAWLGRKAYKEQTTMTLISTRNLLQWANLIAKGIDSKIAYIRAIANKARKDEVPAFADFYNAVFQTSSTDNNSNEVFVTTKGEIETYKQRIIHLTDTFEEAERKSKSLSIELNAAKVTADKLQKQLDQLSDITKIKAERDEFEKKLRLISGALA